MQNFMQTFSGKTRRVMNIPYKTFVRFEVQITPFRVCLGLSSPYKSSPLSLRIKFHHHALYMYPSPLPSINALQCHQKACLLYKTSKIVFSRFIITIYYIKKLIFFYLLCLSKIDRENVFPAVLDNKVAFKDYKNICLLKTQNQNF